MSDDSSDWSSAEELEDWNKDLNDILCLFCEKTFICFDDCLSHLKVDHNLDLIGICVENRIDSIEYIKLINFIRNNNSKSNQMNEIIKSKSYDFDEFMKPVITDDRFLTYGIIIFICFRKLLNSLLVFIQISKAIQTVKN